MSMWLAISAAWAAQPAGAVLRAEDRVEVAATQLTVSADGGRVLAWGPSRATVLGVDGTVGPAVSLEGITGGDIATTGHIALTHEGGVTVHREGGREQVRLAAFGRVHDVAISPDGRRVAIATVLALTVNDTLDGRTLWSADGETTEVAYDVNGALWAKRGDALVGFDGASGRKLKDAAMPDLGQKTDGCVLTASGPLCPVPGAPGVAFDTHLLVLDQGAVEAWRFIDAAGVSALGEGTTAVSQLSWLDNGDLLVARTDGTLERRSPEGSVAAQAAVPNCTNCVPEGMGPAPDNGFWAMSSTGTWLEWDGLGVPRFQKPKVARVLGAARAADGRWVSLDSRGQVRVGSSPGKGAVIGATDPPSRDGTAQGGIAVAGSSIVAWTHKGLVLLDFEGKRRAPSVGPGRLPTAVALSPDGTHVAMLDDGGTLHVYRTADGGAVFRNSVGLSGSVLAWDKYGSTIYAGSEPLRAFALKGTEMGRIVLAPGGKVEALAVSADGTWALANSGLDGTSHELHKLQVPDGLPAAATP
jgi:dipeptidyl aminopeptidase/acylaminoacyl peptidase